jgi:hypothetical protein
LIYPILIAIYFNRHDTRQINYPCSFDLLPFLYVLLYSSFVHTKIIIRLHPLITRHKLESAMLTRIVQDSLLAIIAKPFARIELPNDTSIMRGLFCHAHDHDRDDPRVALYVGCSVPIYYCWDHLGACVVLTKISENNLVATHITSMQFYHSKTAKHQNGSLPLSLPRFAATFVAVDDATTSCPIPSSKEARHPRPDDRPRRYMVHLPAESRIVGGTNAATGLIPFFSGPGCGGSDRRRRVLTAAHCAGAFDGEVCWAQSGTSTAGGAERIIDASSSRHLANHNAERMTSCCSNQTEACRFEQKQPPTAF